MIMKRMKKLLSCLIVLCFVCSVGIPAKAADDTDTTAVATVTINGEDTGFSSLVDAMQFASDNSTDEIVAVVSLNQTIRDCPALNISSGNIILNVNSYDLYFEENINCIYLTGGSLNLQHTKGAIQSNNNTVNDGNYYSLITNDGGIFTDTGTMYAFGSHEGPAINNISGNSYLYGYISNASNSAVYVSSGECYIFSGDVNASFCHYVVQKADNSTGSLNIVPGQNQTVKIRNYHGSLDDSGSSALAYNANIGGEGLVRLYCYNDVWCDYGVSNCNFNPSCNVEIMVEKASDSKGAMTADCIDKIGTPNNIYVGDNLSNIERVDSLTTENVKKKCIVITTNPIYNITYENNGGTGEYGNEDMITKYIATCETDLTGSGEIDNPGYTFNGWYENADLSGDSVKTIDSTATGDKTFYAKWTENPHHTITYNTNDGNYVEGYTPPTEYIEGQTVYLPTADDIEKPGYKFGGWYTDSDCTESYDVMIRFYFTCDMTYYAKWTKIPSHTVTLNTNDGNYAEDYTAPTEYLEGDSVALPTADNITKAGYTFGGWYENDDFSGDAVTEIGTTETTDKTYYAKWTQNPHHTVTFDNNDGSFNSSYTVPEEYVEGAGLTLPTADNITKAGYTFVGWYENDDFSGETITEIGASETTDKTYYAKWTENPHHTVTFDTTDGSFAEGYTVPYEYVEGVGLTLPVEKNIVKQGYAFDGWYENADLSGSRAINITSDDTENKTYYAKWISENSILGKHYSTNQVFDCQRKTTTDDNDVTYQYCTQFKYPYVAYECTSHPFTTVSVDDIDGFNNNDGWYYKFDNDGTDSNYPITLKLYNKDGELEKLISDAGNIVNYGQGCFMYVASQIRTDGTSLHNFYGYFITSLSNNYHIYGTCDEDAECSLYDLDSFVKAGCGEKYAIQYTNLSQETIESTIMDNITLTFSYNGDTYTKDEVKDQLLAIPPVQFTAPDHYEFVGWNTKEDGSGEMYGESATFSENTTLYAIYKLKVHSITFIQNDGTFIDGYIKPTSYNEGTTHTLPTADEITKDGYTFGGWYLNDTFSGDEVTDIKTTDTSDKTFYAKWIKDDVVSNIALNLNDGDFADDYSAPTEYTEGTETVLPTAENLNYDGYTFDGWFENNDFSGEAVTSITSSDTGDKTYYAKWTQNSTFVKPTFTRTDDSVVLSDTTAQAITVGYAYIGSSDLAVDSWSPFVEAGSAFTNVNGKNGYSKKMSPDNGYTFSLTKVGYYTAYIKYTDESGSVILDYYTFNLEGSEPLYNTIALNENDGVYVSNYSKPTQYEQGTALTLPTATNIKKDGYTFGGWYENDDFSGEAVTVISAEDSGDKTYYAKWTERATFVKPTFTRTDNNIVLSDEDGKATTVAYEYIGTSDLEINSWDSFVSAGLNYTDINGKSGYTKKLSPSNGYSLAMSTVGFYAAFIKYTNEDGVTTLDYYTYQVQNDDTTPEEELLPEFYEDGNDKVLVSNGYTIISVGYSYTGHTPHAFEGWDDFVNYGKQYTYTNSNSGYKKLLSPVDGATISLVDGGYYTCFIKYYDKDNNIQFVGATYQIGDKTPYFIMNSNGGAEMYNNDFEIVSTGYIYCPDGIDIDSCKTWDGFLEAGQQCAMNTDIQYTHDNYSTVTYSQNLAYRKIYDPNNEAILYFDAADNGYTGGSYVSFIKYKDGDQIKFVWEDYNIIY